MTSQAKSQDKNKMCEIDESITRIFDIRKRLGKGAYGIVWKAMNKRTNATVAVKKIFDAFRDETDAQRTFREIMFLKAFHNHPNIVQLLNVYKAVNNLDIYLVFEFMESDLHNIIKKGTVLKDVHKRYVMYQLINAIRYIHSGNVIHRDLKPSNVLIDSKCRCKLADFGLARSLARANGSRDDIRNSDSQNEGPLLTDYVATRWYRAPEILVASKKYTKGIDMWSLGCILAEMLRGKPLFQGESTVHQIEKIVNAMPEITESDINAVGAGFGSALLNKQISRESCTTLDELLAGAPHDALDMAKSLLVLDPSARLTATDCLHHVYVDRFRNSTPESELDIDVVPPFRDDVRLTVPEYRSKLYEIVQPPYGEKPKSAISHSKSAVLRPVCNTESLELHKVIHHESVPQISKKTMRSKGDPEAEHEKLVAHHNQRNNQLKSTKLPPKMSASTKTDTTLRTQSNTRGSLTKSGIAKDASSRSQTQLQQQQYLYHVEQLKQQYRQHQLATHQHSQPPQTYTDSQTPLGPANRKPLYVADERAPIVVPRSKQQPKPRPVGSDESLRSINLEKRSSLDGGYQSLQDVSQAPPPQTPAAPATAQKKSPEQPSSRRYRSTCALQRPQAAPANAQPSIPNVRPSPALSRREVVAVNGPQELRARSNSMMTLQTSGGVPVRHTRSDIQKTQDGAKRVEERVCYQERLDQLEQEIEKYKREVKNFCKETYRTSRMRDEPVAMPQRHALRKKSNSSLVMLPNAHGPDGQTQSKSTVGVPAPANGGGGGGGGYGHANGKICSGYGRANGKVTSSGYGGEPNRRSTPEYRIAPYASASNSNTSLDHQKSERDLTTYVSTGGSGDHIPQPKNKPFQQHPQQQQQQQQQSQYRVKSLSKFLKKSHLNEPVARHHTYLSSQMANAR